MRLLPCLLIAGCGRFGFDATTGGTSDGALGDGHTIDSGGLDVAPPACTSFGSFGPPAKLAVQTANDDWAPTPTRGGAELFFYSCTGSGNCDLMEAAPSSPVVVGSLSTSQFNEVSPTLTADGLDLVYATDDMGSFHLREAHRADAMQPFAVTSDLPNLSGGTGVIDRDAFMTADGTRLVFLSTRAGGGVGHLYEATRASPAVEFGPPTAHLELAVGGEISPTLSADGLEIFFSSLGGGGPGGFDIFRATRPALDQPFGAPALVSELNTTMDELGMRLSEDGATLYLNWDTVSGGGSNADLYSATRGCL